MSLLDTLKSLLGMERTDRRAGGDSDVGVTVERETDDEPAPVSSPSPDQDTVETEAEVGTEGESESDESEPDEGESEDAESTADDDGGVDGEAGEPTDSLEGIGPAYGERLADAGVETVGDLADADADALAEETDIAKGRLETWVERAADR